MIGTRTARRRLTRRPSDTGASVFGQVSGPNHGDLSYTVVVLYNAAGDVVTAPGPPVVAANGKYGITGVPDGTWMAFCQPAPSTPLVAMTYQGKESWVGSHGTPITVATGAEITGINFRLPAAGIITVSVVDSSGAPISGATVLSFLSTANRFACGNRPPPLTDANGLANLANVPLKSKLAIVTPAGTRLWWDGATNIRKSAAVSIAQQGGVAAIDVTIPPGM